METTTTHLFLMICQIVGFCLIGWSSYKIIKTKRTLRKKLTLTKAYADAQTANQLRQYPLETYVLDHTVRAQDFNELTVEKVEEVLRTQMTIDVASAIADHIAVSHDRKPYAKNPDLSIRARVLFRVVNELKE